MGPIYGYATCQESLHKERGPKMCAGEPRKMIQKGEVWTVGKTFPSMQTQRCLKMESLSLTLYCWEDHTFRVVEGIILLCLFCFVLYLAH